MSVFGRLFRYQPRPGRTPREDYLTEALAATLESSAPLRCDFFRYLTQQEVSVVRVRTQYSRSGRRFDLRLDGRPRGQDSDHIAVLEHKVDASEDELQLAAYADWLHDQRNAGSRTLAFVAPVARGTFTPAHADVRFRRLRWADVADSLRESASRVDDEAETKGAVLVEEFHRLLHEWGLAMTLNATQLTAAVTHRTSGEAAMIAVLDEAWNKVPEWPPLQGQWRYDRQHLCYTSPRMANGQLRFSYGFDFERADEIWHVADLGLPSAYVGVLGPGAAAMIGTDGWTPPPQPWGWEAASRVRQIERMGVNGGSLHEQYVTFFTAALAQVGDTFEGAE